MHLFGAMVNGTDTELYEFSHKKQVNGHDALVRAVNATQKFQFFRCNVPYGKYKSGGQVRSAANHSMCVTPGAVYRWNSNLTATQYPAEADARISLQPCATEHSLHLRKQWFAKTATPKNCISQLSLQGWRSDAPSDAVIMSENGVALGSRTLNSTIYELYLGPPAGFNATCHTVAAP